MKLWYSMTSMVYMKMFLSSDTTFLVIIMSNNYAIVKHGKYEWLDMIICIPVLVSVVVVFASETFCVVTVLEFCRTVQYPDFLEQSLYILHFSWLSQQSYGSEIFS